MNVLKRHIQRLNKEHPNRIREESDPKTGQPVKSVEAPATPPQWSLIIGDIAHNLRSALDHLAWQVAIESSPNNDPQKDGWRRAHISWPIFTCEADFTDTTKPRLWRRDAPRSDFATKMIDFQPYKRWTPPKEDPLWLLSELSNIDKHRLLHGTVIDLRNLPIEPIRTVTFDPVTKERHAVTGPPRGRIKKVGVVITPGREPYSYAEGDFRFEVEIRQRGTVLHEQPVLRLVDSIRREVRSVIDAFEPLF